MNFSSDYHVNFVGLCYLYILVGFRQIRLAHDYVKNGAIIELL